MHFVNYYRMALLLLFIGLMAPSSSAYAQEIGVLSPKLEILWSKPISALECESDLKTKKRICTGGAGLSLSDGILLPDDRMAFLGRVRSGGIYETQILIGNEQSFPQISLPIKQNSDDSYLFSLAPDSEENFLLAGYADKQYGFPIGAVYAKPYVVKLDQTGKPIFEKTLDRGDWRIAQHISSSASGFFVAGRENQNSWLARLDTNGNPLWEAKFGASKGLAITALPGDRALIAGFIGHGVPREKTYQEDVVVWLVNENGVLSEPITVQAAINDSRAAHYGRIEAKALETGAYVLSQWGEAITRDRGDLKPVYIAYLDIDGNVIWTRGLSETIGNQVGTARFELCEHPALSALPNGNALVACVLSGKIQLYELDQKTGHYKFGYVPLPECHEGRSSKIFLFSKQDGTLLLTGTRHESNQTASCTWMGRLTL